MRTIGCLALVASTLTPGAHAQDATAHRDATDERFGICVPQAERTAHAVGCFIITDRQLDSQMPPSVYWHLTRFASLRTARAAEGRNGVALEAYGVAWLMTIADASWRAASGVHVAAIGPLRLGPGVRYSALYMEASMQPGMTTPVHRHSGDEAWYTLRGETCLETPEGAQTGRAQGPPVIVPGGLPMRLTATGRTLRQSLVLILHDASRSPTTMDSTWTPRGLCRG